MKMNIFRLMKYILPVMVISGCTGILEESDLLIPRPAVSEYFKTGGAGFIGTAQGGRLTNVKYALTLRLEKEIRNKIYLKICFDNPADHEVPICIEDDVSKGDSEIIIKSPIVYGLVDRKSYAVVVSVYSDPGKTQLIGNHRQLIRYYELKL
jgi:hypothetical protein